MQKQKTPKNLTSALLNMQDDIREMKAVLNLLLLNQPNMNNSLVFGIFTPNEWIRSCDRRLWSLPNSPFKNQHAVYNAKLNGCPFKKKGGRLAYIIKASILEKWIKGEPIKDDELD